MGGENIAIDRETKLQRALADPDGYSRGDVFSGAECSASRRAAARRPRVQGAGRRAGPEFEPIETKPPAQLVEHARAAAGEGGGCRSELQPLAGRHLADP